MSRRSKKRSATSSGEQAELVFFVDRSLGRGDVPDALEAAGAKVERHDAHFEKDTEDAVWIEDVCKRGWIILTKDKAIRRRADERQRILDGGGRAFFLTSGGLNGAAMAEIFVDRLSAIRRACTDLMPPILAIVTRTAVEVFDAATEEWVSIIEAKRRRRRQKK